MSGYEIQHLAIKFEGRTEAINQITGEETTAPNGFSLCKEI
jgi:hypothetical protein